MTPISVEELYRVVKSNPRYLEAVLRFYRYGEFPEELQGQSFPGLERVAAEIKAQLREEERERQ